MRTTESIGYRTLLENVNMLNNRIQHATKQASSGRKISYPHDAPADNAELMRLKRQISDLDQYQLNADNSGFYMKVAESTLNSVYDLVTAVFTRGSAAANNFQDPAARATYAAEIRSLRDQIFSLANTEARGRSLFSGSHVDAPAFTMDGDSVTYQGNTDVNTVDISGNLQVKTNIPGSTVFDPVFANVGSLLAAVESGDQAAIQEALGQFPGAFTTVSRVRAALGVDLAKLQDSDVARQEQQINIQSRQSQIGDADIAEAITQLNQARTALQAALTVGSVIGQQTLFDYMG